MIRLTIFLLFTFLFTTIGFAPLPGSGTVVDPYIISNCTALHDEIRLNLSASYALDRSINCGIAPFNVGLGFDPIGNSSNRFEGNFNGNNFTISNLYINRPNQEYVGLFGDSFANSISNIYFEGTSITGNNYTGLISGSATGNFPAFDLIITNVYVTSSSVSGYDRVGGLVGNSDYIQMVNNSFRGIISGNNRVGGFIGESEGFSRNNSFSGDVSGNNYIGGFVGYSDGLTQVTSTSGTVSGNDYVGGVAGFIRTDFESSYSSSTVSGNDYVGGFAGGTEHDIRNSFSSGDVSGNNSVGGFLGLSVLSGESIDNSFTTSTVSGNFNVGLLLGERSGGTYNSVYAHNYSGNTLPLVGLGTSVGSVESDISYFYDCSNSPLNAWDLSSFNCSGSSLPFFTWDEPMMVTLSSSGSSSFFPVGNMFISLMLVLVFLLY